VSKVSKLGSNKSKERKKLIKQCDTLVSLIVRDRDKRCVCCGSTERLQCGHLIKRGKAATRFNLTNCNCQCSSCNFKHNQYPEHYTNWFLTVYDLTTYKELIRESLQIKKWTVEELRELKQTLESLRG
jgi:hypothetical protein